MKLIKPMTTLALGAALVFGASGCGIVPTPFEQDVPATQWTVDEDGNKVKVAVGDIEVVSEPQQVVDTMNDFYKSSFSKKTAESFGKLYQRSEKMGDNPSEEDKKAFLKEFNKDFAHIIEHLDTEGLKDEELVPVVSLYATFGALGAGAAEVKVPVQAVRIFTDKKGNRKAEVDVTELEMYTNGEKIEGSTFAGDDTPVTLILKDGKWLIEISKDMIPPKESDK